MSEWISVEDRLPEENTQVIAANQTSGVVEFGFFQRVVRHGGHGSPIDNKWYTVTYYCDGLTINPTHWKPLPPPPK